MKTKKLIAAALAVFGMVTACGNDLAEYREGDIRIDVRAGGAWLHDFPVMLGIKLKNPPQVAIWAEDLSGRYLSTLYVTHRISSAAWRSNGGNPRKEALPVWCHARGGQPTRQTPVADGASGATPLASFDVKVRPTGGPRRFVVKIEVNHSTDWNDIYPKNAAEGEGGYSGGSGGSGQPALVYAAEIDLDSPRSSYTARLVGHSSPDGSDGDIRPDTSSLTTALDIVKDITINIQ